MKYIVFCQAVCLAPRLDETRRTNAQPSDALGEVEQLVPDVRRRRLLLLQLIEEHCTPGAVFHT